MRMLADECPSVLHMGTCMQLFITACSGSFPLSPGDQCRLRDRSTIVGRHLSADRGDSYADQQLHSAAHAHANMMQAVVLYAVAPRQLCEIEDRDMSLSVAALLDSLHIHATALQEWDEIYAQPQHHL